MTHFKTEQKVVVVYREKRAEYLEPTKSQWVQFNICFSNWSPLLFSNTLVSCVIARDGKDAIGKSIVQCTVNNTGGFWSKRKQQEQSLINNNSAKTYLICLFAGELLINRIDEKALGKKKMHLFLKCNLLRQKFKALRQSKRTWRRVMKAI